MIKKFAKAIRQHLDGVKLEEINESLKPDKWQLEWTGSSSGDECYIVSDLELNELVEVCVPKELDVDAIIRLVKAQFEQDAAFYEGVNDLVKEVFGE